MSLRNRRLIIAIDGPAGSGKSSTAKALAMRLRVPYIDTGAMYRALTLKAMRRGIPFLKKTRLVAISRKTHIRLSGGDPSRQRVLLDGKDVTREIRLPEVTKNVFYIAQEPLIRKELVRMQRAMGKRGGGVMEGRDIGTVVFPDADYKFYFEASPKIRARRRYEELLQAGGVLTLRSVLKDIKKRDKTDYERKNSPLKRAKGAVLIDTTRLTINQTIDKIMSMIDSNPLISVKLKRLYRSTVKRGKES